MRKSYFIIFLIFSLIFVGLIGVVNATCSGDINCNKPNQNSCNAQEYCSWVDGSCSATASCSDISDEGSCDDAGGCTWTASGGGGSTSTATSSGGGTTVQNVVGISPQSPLGGDTLYQGENELKVKIYYAGEANNRAEVHANSSMFGLVELTRFRSDPDGIYKANVNIGENVSFGNNRIFYTAEVSSEFNEMSFLVDVKSGLDIDMQLDEKYYKGRKISFSGKVFDLNNLAVSNASITIKWFYSGAESLTLTSVTNESGDFYVDKNINHGQKGGILNIKVIAESPDGKVGVKNLETEIDFAEGISYYNVNFLSPLKDKPYRRGETIPVSIKVEDINGNPIEKAKVDIFNTKGERISIGESREKGIYSGNYVVEKDARLEKWFLETEVSKTEGDITRFGGVSIPIIIGSTEININLKSLGDVKFTNSRLKIRAELTYSDGSPVKGTKPKASLSNGEIIELKETKDGLYEGAYFIQREDVGTLKIFVEVEDSNQNIGALEKNIVVRERSFIGNIFGYIFDFLLRYLWEILAFILFSGYISKQFIETKIIILRINKLKKDINNLKTSQKDLEKRYYEQGNISKKEFNISKENYEKKIGNKESSIKELRNKLSGKISPS